MNKIKKILSRIERKIIFALDGVNTKKYMLFYNKWLIRNGMKINGKAKYIHHTVLLDGTGYDKISIGNNVVISLGCTILVHDFSLEAGKLAIGIDKSQSEAYFMKEVKIGDNCFIGANTTILGGTELGENCIVGAGSVLPGKKYPRNSIIAGNPAVVIGDTIEWTKKKLDSSNYNEGFFN